MIEAIAKSKYVRVPPRKARLMADLIRGLSAEEAILTLAFAQTKAARLLSKTLQSAIANAESRFDVDREDLTVRKAFVDQGPAWKRAKSKCRGGRAPILKRTSHFTIVVGN